MKYQVLNRQSTLERAIYPGATASLFEDLPDHISWIRNFLSLPGRRRQENMSEIISLTSELKFFKNLSSENTQEVIETCWLYFQYEFFPVNSIIIRQGEFGDKLFLILSGEVQVLRKEANEIQDRGVLKQGESFGERAIMLGMVRNASIKALTDCHLATMDREHYKRILEEIFNENFRTLALMLRRVPTLKGVSNQLMQRVCYNFNKIELNKRDAIFQEGDPVGYVYLILTGEVRLMKRQYLKLDSTSLNRCKVLSKDFEMTSLGEGEIVGDEEVVEGTSTRSFSCICHTDVVIYSISKENYMKSIFIGEEAEHLKAKIKLKLEHRNMLIKKNKKLLKIKAGMLQEPPERKILNFPLISKELKPVKLFLPIQAITKSHTRRGSNTVQSISQRNLTKKAGLSKSKTQRSLLTRSNTLMNIHSYSSQIKF